MAEIVEPKPQIVITCDRITIPGRPGQFSLSPSLSYGQMPGGWVTVHQILMECAHQVALEMVKEAQGHQQRLVEVAQGYHFPQG